jgi:hypothetical protein
MALYFSGVPLNGIPMSRAWFLRESCSANKTKNENRDDEFDAVEIHGPED